VLKNNSFFKIGIIAGLVLVVMICIIGLISGNSVLNLPTPTPTRRALPTIDLTPKPTPTMIHPQVEGSDATAEPANPPEATAVPQGEQPQGEGYAALSPGEYLMMLKGADLTALSADGSRQIALVRGVDWVTTSAYDGKTLQFYKHKALIRADLETGLQTEYPEVCGAQCTCSQRVLSPDGQWAALYCANTSRLQVVPASNSQTAIDLTGVLDDADVKGEYNYPRWSPDGKTLAFFRRKTVNGDEARDGLYLTGSECFSTPETCKDKTAGPFTPTDGSWMDQQGPYAWSPDSHFLAAPSNSFSLPLRIFQVGSKGFRTLDLPGIVGSITGLAWSPDGKSLAASIDETPNEKGAIYLIPLDGTAPQKISDERGPLVAWLSAYPRAHFVKDSQLEVSGAGNGFQVRISPTTKSRVSATLQPGQPVKIVDGPAIADGFQWWKISIEGGGTGWVSESPDMFIQK
jgi:hypothetical protein